MSDRPSHALNNLQPGARRRHAPAGRRKRAFRPRLEALEERCVLDVRSITGVGNNIANPLWGSAGVALLRQGNLSAYADGIDDLVVGNPARPSPREISNSVVAQTTA